MKLSEIRTSELRRILRATEGDAGPDSTEARILRRELVKREQQAREKRRKGVSGDPRSYFDAHENDERDRKMNGNEPPPWFPGLTKRELGAFLITAGLIDHELATGDARYDDADVAACAVSLTDILLAELAKEPKQ